jgi:hypothetical protein
MSYRPEDKNIIVINTCDNTGVMKDISPFCIGPCYLYGDRKANIFENAWQFTKVYPQHVGEDQSPTMDYWNWANEGWSSQKPHRYPMGKGKVPLYCLWDGKRLGYIDSRKQIYAPLYIKAIENSAIYARLKQYVEDGRDIVLKDWDGYDHDKMNMTLEEVLNNPKRKMGHSFVLKALLTDDYKFLTQLGL